MLTRFPWLRELAKLFVRVLLRDALAEKPTTSIKLSSFNQAHGTALLLVEASKNNRTSSTDTLAKQPQRTNQNVVNCGQIKGIRFRKFSIQTLHRLP